jgi:Mrp family chromosome partitioning ATPase
MNIVDSVSRAFDGLASRLDASGLRSVGFTSAVLGEGVSTIALGTGLALAALRQDRVLLVDANWMQPSLTEDARLQSKPGFADYLARRATLSEIVREGQGSPLTFVPIGQRGVARPTLRTLAAFLANDATAYPTVIVDLPPVLAGEGYVLPWASLLDQLFVVLREAATPLPLARSALERISVATHPQVVLNRTLAPVELMPDRVARLGASRV